MPPMTSGPAAPLTTAADLLRMVNARETIELYAGQPVVKEGHGGWSGPTCTAISARLYNHVHPNRLGWIGDAQTAYLLAKGPDWVCIPDVSYVSRLRLPQLPARGFIPGPPDLAVEVRSPGETWAHTIEKGGIWVAFSTPLVWCVDAIGRRAVSMRGPSVALEHKKSDALSGDPVLPGFSIRLADLFSAFE